MKHQEGEFQGGGQVRLYSQAWLPEGPAQALLVVVHGVTEHSARYATLGSSLASAGIGVWTFDLRGHGRSGGVRGHLNLWTDLPADLAGFLEVVRTRNPDLPVFLFGHSLGSLIVLAHLLDSPGAIRGAILCGTAIEPVGIALPHRVIMARVFSALWPTLRINVRSEGPPMLSRDPRVEAEFRSDPLVLSHVTARFGAESLSLIDFVKQHADSITLPLLMLHGGDDPLNTVIGARGYFDAVRSADKDWILYEGSLHEPHQDREQEKVFSDVRQWVARHLLSGETTRGR